MHRAEAPDQIDGMDADDLAVGEEAGQGVQSDAVGRVVEGRDEHEAVGDVEVGVAGREPLAFEDDRAGHRQRDDLGAAGRPGRVAARSRRRFSCERLVVRVVRVGLDDRDDRLGVDEPGEVVDVAVGVVAGDPPAEPDDVADAQVVGEDALDGRRGRARGCGPGLG